MSTLPEGFAHLSTPDQIRELRTRLNEHDDGSPVQVMLIFTYMQTILDHALADLMNLSTEELFGAGQLLDSGLG